MRKTAILSAVILAALTFGALKANAYCVEPVGVCDQAQVDVVGGVVYGLWDWTCDGVSLIPVLGTVGFGSGSFTGGPPPADLLGLWDINISANTMDFGVSDGTGFAVTFPNVPIVISTGACNFALSSGGGASLMDSLADR